MNRRLLGYLVVNVVVSAAVVIIILIVYDRYYRPATPLPPLDTSAQSTVAIAAIAGAGQLDSEAVSIRNSGQDRLSLDGWVLKDASSAAYTFPALTLLPGGSVTVHSTAGDDTATDLFWGLTEPIWRSGEFATLTDSAGNAQAVYRIP